jgi:hypothetical protein
MKLQSFIDHNNKYKIFKGKRSRDWDKVTYYFENGTQRTLHQHEIEQLIKSNNKPKWIGK